MVYKTMVRIYDPEDAQQLKRWTLDLQAASENPRFGLNDLFRLLIRCGDIERMRAAVKVSRRTAQGQFEPARRRSGTYPAAGGVRATRPEVPRRGSSRTGTAVASAAGRRA